MQAFIQDIINAGGQAYQVGGGVRDMLMGIATKDLDLLVTKISQDKLTTLLKKHGRVNLVGKSFGVIKFKMAGQPGADHEKEIDIALPRVEKSSGSGHKDFIVDFDPNIPVEIDLGRRDFTINAMAQNLQNGEIIDPYGGQNDLKNRSLKVVFSQAFAEDPLRLLRAVQFAARFGLSIHEETLNLMNLHADKITTVSSERVVEEIKKLLSAPKPSIGFDLMRETKILHYLFPEVEKMIGSLQPAKHGGDVYTHTMRVLDAARSHGDLEQPGDLDTMFAALFHDIGKPKTRAVQEDGQTTFYGHQNVSVRMARKWFNKFPVQMIGVNPDTVLNLVGNHMFETKSYFGDKPIRRFIRKVGPDVILKLIDLRVADKKGGAYPDSVKGVFKLRKLIKEELEKKPPFSVKDLSINGATLMQLGFAAGPNMGIILKAVLEHVLDFPENNTETTLTSFVLENFGQLRQTDGKKAG